MLTDGKFTFLDEFNKRGLPYKKWSNDIVNSCSSAEAEKFCTHRSKALYSAIGKCHEE